MSEKLFRLLLCLYPSHFQKAYGDEAVQLLRDRSRDEKGVFPSLRLWFDLLGDLVVTIPRLYFQPPPTAIVAAPQVLAEAPCFFLFENESPSLPAFLSGGALSLVALGAFSLALLHFGSATGDARLTIRQPQPHSRFSPQQTPATPGKQTNKKANSIAEGGTLQAAERHRVIDAAARNLRRYYAYADLGQKMADSLLAHERTGDYDVATDASAFADLLTKQLRDESHDLRLEVVYSLAPLPGQPGMQTSQDVAGYRRLMERQNCTFEKVELLPHAIGYFKLNSFPEISVCRQRAAAAMESLNEASAVIFDLRDNRGGFPEMVTFIASYLFDHPEYMYNPREDTTRKSWTQSPVPGSKLTDKPVFVLTSTRTYSGAEQFSYDLQMLNRATIVGEKTGGGAHAAVFHRIDDHFGMAISESKPVNPFSKPDWEGTGVAPNFKVQEADALDAAEKLALRKLEKQ
jgi:hypothetical protein